LVEAKASGGRDWTSRKPGLEFHKVPASKAVAEKESERTRQLRELSARFAGFEDLREDGPGSGRIDLRLVPRPIYRYSDPEHGLIDGAIFLMVHSTNPEAALILEAVREGDTDPGWRYALTRLTIAELHVALDGDEVWTLPQLKSTARTDPYWVYFLPISRLEKKR